MSPFINWYGVSPCSLPFADASASATRALRMISDLFWRFFAARRRNSAPLPASSLTLTVSMVIRSVLQIARALNRLPLFDRHERTLQRADVILERANQPIVA